MSKQKTDPTSRWESEKPTDFNDLFILEGVEKVREIFEKSQQENAVCDCELDGFRLTEDKLFYYDERSEKYVFVSGYVKVIAQTEDSDGENTGKLLEFKTRRGQLRRLRVLNCWLSKDGDKMREFLLKKWLHHEHLILLKPLQHCKYISHTFQLRAKQ
ncbi:hypothetical protein FACS189472_12610 [Alphaproteobacteria bacterium]|nr:hypothetical protein FACS189472_12610 [Alphaproteobacteria bacterium]